MLHGWSRNLWVGFHSMKNVLAIVSKTILGLWIVLGNINYLSILILPMCKHDAFPHFLVFPSISFIHVLSFSLFNFLTCLATIFPG